MSDDIEFDYDFLMQDALRAMMGKVLTMVADLGDAPGEHHFYIEFLTHAPGVSIPNALIEEYPERMTIVLQHQFESLDVTDEGFGVTLWFKGVESRLEIPFAAITSFADPSVQFGLRFEPVSTNESDASEADDKNEEKPDAQNANADSGGKNDDTTDTSKKDGDDDAGADVVSLDAFRKK
ncbi:MAG: hypothetical protein KJN99_10470 [Marinicaulis sp.]|nr:hypothetical protein [Marinicaulis sp.]